MGKGGKGGIEKLGGEVYTVKSTYKTRRRSTRVVNGCSVLAEKEERGSEKSGGDSTRLSSGGTGLGIRRKRVRPRLLTKKGGSDVLEGVKHYRACQVRAEGKLRKEKTKKNHGKCPTCHQKCELWSKE